ncbi:MAG: hypothetical protein BJ554DRAFT_5594, partial [Olpidium bornovanus]
YVGAAARSAVRACCCPSSARSAKTLTGGGIPPPRLLPAEQQHLPAVFTHIVKQRGLEEHFAIIDSCGTAGYHVRLRRSNLVVALEFSACRGGRTEEKPHKKG